MTNEQQREQAVRGSGTASSQKWAVIGMVAFAALLLAIEHRVHVSEWISAYGIWLVVLACPLMHLFMHRGHGGHARGRNEEDRNR